MKFGVVIFPGSNCDQDVIHVLRDVMQAEVIELWHKDHDISAFDVKTDMLILPGGFSYGDYLRSGAIARFSPIMDEVVEFAKKGGKLWGICNGFQILCEAGLLPGALVRNANQKFICRNTYIKSADSDSLLTASIPPDQVLKMPIAHAEGRYYTDEKTLQSLKDHDQILFYYCDEKAQVTEESNPNGSLENIAGICNARRNVFGMMPHPERASEDILGNADGKLIFDSIFQHKTSYINS